MINSTQQYASSLIIFWPRPETVRLQASLAKTVIVGFFLSLLTIPVFAHGHVSSSNSAATTEPIILICPPNITIACSASTLPANTGNAVATDICGGTLVITYADITVAANCPLVYRINRTWTATDACNNTSTCLQVISLQDITGPTLTCPPDTIIACDAGTLPEVTGMVSATDNCSSSTTISYVDYIDEEPAVAPEMRWVYLPPGAAAGDCVSSSDCSTGQLCFGLQYIPGVSGTLNSYTSGFLVDCINGINPITYNASCVMTDNSDTFNICDPFGDIYMNSSGHTGSFPVEHHVPVFIHQICVQLGPGESILIEEDVITNLTTNVVLAGGGAVNEEPSYESDIIAYDDYCPDACIYPYTIYRQFLVTDDCNNLSTCVQTIVVEDNSAPVFDCPPDLTLAYPANTDPVVTGWATASDCSEASEITYLDSLPMGSCPALNFVKRTWYASDACGNAGSCVQWIIIDDNGTICGSVVDDLSQPLGGVTIELHADLNSNQQIDAGDTLVATTVTAISDGSYCFSDVRPCEYVVREVQPLNYGQQADYDTSPEPDGDDSADGPDDEIPVIVGQVENDLDNNFIDIICPTEFPPFINDTICEGASVMFEMNDPGAGLVMISWDFGDGSDPSTGNGLGPHTVTYDTTGENQLNGADVFLTLSKAGCPVLVEQVGEIIVNPFPDPSIDASLAPMCYYTERIFQPLAPLLPDATYSWNFGSNAVPATASGYGPHSVYYTAAGTKTVKLVILPNDPGAMCSDSSTIMFQVNSCPGQILGYVWTADSTGITNVNVRLYADANTDGIADTTVAVKNVFTNSDGFYSMATITPGHYVIVETQPVGWVSIDDFDDSDDADAVPNISNLDNKIPATILPGELDSMNNFIEGPQPAMITGYVFIDNDNDQVPDAGEGLTNVLVSLYEDEDLDGEADSPLIIASALTDGNGMYTISNVVVGSYVLVAPTPNGYLSVRDYDASNDGDLVANTNQNNDTIPLTLINAEIDEHNYFIDAAICSRVVTSLSDNGYGTLRYNIECAEAGDTITFHPLLAGQTININSDPLDLPRDIVILSTLSPKVIIASSTNGLFFIPATTDAEFNNLIISSGLTDGSIGAAIDNSGSLKLVETEVRKNPIPASGIPLVLNKPGAVSLLVGNCLIMQNP